MENSLTADHQTAQEQSNLGLYLSVRIFRIITVIFMLS